MNDTEPTFTAAERKAALVAIIIASVVTVLGLVLDGLWSRPSLGYYGDKGVAAGPNAATQDARPVAS